MYRGTIIDELIAAVAKIQEQELGKMADSAELMGDYYQTVPATFSGDVSLAGVA